MNFAELLDHYMNELHTNAVELSRLSGLDRTVIGRFRSGQRVPRRDNPALAKLSAGLGKLARSSGRDDLTESEIYHSLLDALPTLDFDPEAAAQRLDGLMKELGVTRRELAEGTHFVSSTVSRILSGERTPKNVESFYRQAAEYLASDEERVPLIKELTGTGMDGLYDWLTAEETPTVIRGQEPVHGFLQNLDSFDLNEYIRAIHFDELKIPTMPFQLPTTHTATGLKDMMETELNFLKATALSRSKHPVLIYSDMPMEKMADDPDFPKKWMLGMAALLKKGLRLNMIHNVDRPFKEMMLGLEAYIPMYMTGQISPYYLEEKPSRVFHHLLEVSGAAALAGRAIVGHHEDGEYYLTKSREEIVRYQKQADQLLELAKPLMEIYTGDREAALQAFIDRETGGEENVRILLSTMPLFTLPEELLESILAENTLAPEEADAIRALRLRQRAWLKALDPEVRVTLEVPLLTETEFAQYPVTLPVSTLFLEKDLPCTYGEYRQHISMLEQAMRDLHPNAEIFQNERFPLRNVQILIRSGRWAMVSKGKSPTIHFVMRHPKLVNAIERFVPPVAE